MKNLLIISSLALILFGCESKPKVVEISEVNMEGVGGSSQGNEAANATHQVIVEETLSTDKYTYLNVREGDKTFWIAIPLSEVSVGETLVFRGGLMKKNFQSREFNRVFETLYLVSDIQRATPPSGAMGSGTLPQGSHPDITPPDASAISPVQGAITIATLLKDKAKYDGKKVKITGKCMKINPMIMNRNWIHIQDGTADNHDLTITSQESIPLGHVVTFEGTVSLNKDFGAGYRYDLIIEDAVILR